MCGGMARSGEVGEGLQIRAWGMIRGARGCVRRIHGVGALFILDAHDGWLQAWWEGSRKYNPGQGCRYISEHHGSEGAGAALLEACRSGALWELLGGAVRVLLRRRSTFPQVP